VTYAADLHLHSPYAYASSPSLTLENLADWAKLKGIDLLATGDFTHPAWFRELREKLTPAGEGVYRFGGAAFVLGTEVSCVFRQGGRGRRVHLLVLAPHLEAAVGLRAALTPWGNVEADGRPTLGLSVRDFTALVLDVNPDYEVIPAHLWTPWYGAFGSKSGFDGLEEAFQDMTPQVHAVETGLSSDPAMNWDVPDLAGRTIVSFSDAHSLPKLGRELTFFRGEASCPGLRRSLAGDGVAFTVEFYPEEGKYHYSGHRRCGVRQAPEETLREGRRCPVCRRPLTLGVLHRTRHLSQDPKTYAVGPDGFIPAPPGRSPFIRLVPLLEIVGQALGQGPETRRVVQLYRRIVQELGSEVEVLLRASEADLAAAAGEAVAEGVLRARRGQVSLDPGYDGVYGRVSLWPAGPPAAGAA
jgi:uncharacterized protein (TIGR00375 family)